MRRLSIRHSLFAILFFALLAALAYVPASADGRVRGSRAYADPAYLGSPAESGCKRGPRLRYQMWRRCVYRSAVITMRVPSRRETRSAAFTPQVPGNLRASAGPLGREQPGCPPYLAAQLKCSDYFSADPFVRALIDNPNPATKPTLDAYGIPAIDGVPPVVILNPYKAAPPFLLPGLLNDPLFLGPLP